MCDRKSRSGGRLSQCKTRRYKRQNLLRIDFFIRTLKDSRLATEVEKANLEIEPIDGAGVERSLNRLYEMEPAVVCRVKPVLESK